MGTQNVTMLNVFILGGFHLGHQGQAVLFVVFFIIYLLSITANILIIIIVRTNRRLHNPMYFFLSNFSFVEIWYISVTVPKILVDLLSSRKTISADGCFIQFYFLFFFGSTENFFLAIMSFDRYVAICYPLRYLIIMSDTFCKVLAAGAWIVSAIIVVIVIIPLTRLSFCGSQEIDHVFCDFSPLVKFSCHGSKSIEIIFFFLAGLVILGCFTLIMVTYVHIMITVLATSSASGLRNAFTTCASHFFVVFIYYGTVIFMYVRPTARRSFHGDKVISVFYSALTPLLNPLIYCLRNKEVKEAMRRTFRISVQSIHKENNVTKLPAIDRSNISKTNLDKE
ncbi:olfactory receptor 6B9-like [Ascaphus truei]|uniref:olfactory receptor 6B9-like n=1 Tax=Ascaphus truei TaxID=8439 RepID=UPI003F5A8B7C